VRRIAEEIRRRRIFRDVVCVFWKEAPYFRDLPEVTEGEVLVVPVMAADGYYARTVLPREIGAVARVTPALGVRAEMADLIVAAAGDAARAQGFDLSGARLLIVGHGTRRDPQGSGDSTYRHADAIAGDGRVRGVDVAFLEQDPQLTSVLAAIPGREAVIIVPNLIADGGHAVDDIPAGLGLAPGARTGEYQGRPIVLARAVGERPELADLVVAAAHDAMDRRGHVALVGAGPGDPELITVKGLRRLREADVVLYDRLAPRELLAEAPAHARLIDVGKHPGRPTPSQPWINELIVAHARRGERVVRLKGGDPFVFGRGGEEAMAALEAGLDLEIVPGITAGVAAPAAAGVPVTHRGVARSVALVTAVTDWDHPANTPGQETQIDDVAHADTICIYMGLGQIATIAARLIELGRDRDTPVMSISKGCTPAQREVISTLASIAADVAAAGLESPVLTVIGEVVRLRANAARAEEVMP
jgi:uroporphyrin-III C-methyltransferase